MTRARLFACLLGTSLLGACTAHRTNYDNFLDHMPRSILVLPPVNLTTDAKASTAFVSTISSPLAECGYYVFPIAVVDELMKENGLPMPADMHQVPLSKIDEVFGADAVLYIVIKRWDTQYLLIDTATTVTLQYRLADVKTGLNLWNQEITIQHHSSAGSRSILELLVSAAVTAIAKAASTPEWGVAREANGKMFADARRGLLKGPRHPDFAKDQDRHRNERAAAAPAPAPASP